MSFEEKTRIFQVLPQVTESPHDACGSSPSQSSGPSLAGKLSAHGLLTPRKCPWELGPLLLFTVFSFKVMKAEHPVISIEKLEYKGSVGAPGVAGCD